MPSPPDNFCYVFLTNSTGGVDMDVDGSSTAVTFTYTVPAGKKLQLSRLNMSIVDGGMGYGEFAGLGSALSNGLTLKVHSALGVELLDFTNGQNIKGNEDFSNLAGVDAVSQLIAGEDFFPVRFTVSNAGDTMVLKAGYEIRSIVQDNLSDITRFRIMVQGVYK